MCVFDLLFKMTGFTNDYHEKEIVGPGTCLSFTTSEGLLVLAAVDDITTCFVVVAVVVLLLVLFVNEKHENRLNKTYHTCCCYVCFQI